MWFVHVPFQDSHVIVINDGRNKGARWRRVLETRSLLLTFEMGIHQSSGDSSHKVQAMQSSGVSLLLAQASFKPNMRVG